MSDVLQRLKSCDPLASVDQLNVLIALAIAEIERLRSLTGATSDGMSMADIKRELGIKTTV